MATLLIRVRTSFVTVHPGAVPESLLLTNNLEKGIVNESKK